MNKVIKVNLNDRKNLKEFYKIITGINNKINLCDYSSTNVKELNIYSWMDLREPLCIEIESDGHENTQEAYELLKRFEVE